MQLHPLWYHITLKKKVWAGRKCTAVLLMTQHLKALALARKQREKMEHNACVRLFEEQHWQERIMHVIAA